MRNRISSFEYVSPSELDGHPQNWRLHPNTQKSALQEVLDRVGMADALLVWRSQATGRLTLVDGHLRRELLANEEKIPVLVLDITDEEAKAILASHDPIGAMAQRNDALFSELLDQIAQQGSMTDLVRMLDADGSDESKDGKIPGEDEFTPPGPAVYEIVPTWDEGYDAVIITCATTGEMGQLQTLLKLPTCIDRRGRVGTSQVITAQHFFNVLKEAREAAALTAAAEAARASVAVTPATEGAREVQA